MGNLTFGLSLTRARVSRLMYRHVAAAAWSLVMAFPAIFGHLKRLGARCQRGVIGWIRFMAS